MRRGILTAVAALSGALCVTLVALWAFEPGQFLFVSAPGNQYSLWSVQGTLSFSIVHLVWPPPTNANAASVIGWTEVFRLPIWPLVLLTAPFPVLWFGRMWKSRKRPGPDQPGFPVEPNRKTR
jgi:hypothetical protein